MSTYSRMSEGNLRRIGRFLRGSKKSLNLNEYSRNDMVQNVNKKSASLSSLLESGDILQPRMEKLETLEAKMVCIENSLLKNSRRKMKDSLNVKELLTEIETLKNNLRQKDLMISKLRTQIFHLCSQFPKTQAEKLNEVEKEKVRTKLIKIQQEMGNKRTALKNLRSTLEKLDMSNIDARIRQAEIESKLEKEELDILSLQEDSLTLEMQLQDGCDKERTTSFFDVIKPGMQNSLLSLSVPYNCKNPSFTAGSQDNERNIIVDWAEESTGLKKGDRIIEMCGQLVINSDKKEFWGYASSHPSPFHLVILRSVPQLPVRRPNSRELLSLKEDVAVLEERLQATATDNRGLVRLTERLKAERENLRAERTRLLHRVAYLEDRYPSLSANGEATIFQKGQRVTILNLDSHDAYSSPDPYSGPYSHDSAYGSLGPPDHHVKLQSSQDDLPGVTSSIIINSDKIPYLTKFENDDKNVLRKRAYHRESNADRITLNEHGCQKKKTESSSFMEKLASLSVFKAK